jgi:hypothetical protein
MINKSYLLFAVVFAVSSGVCAFGQSKDPNAAEVLRRYKQSLSWQESVSMKVDTDVKAKGDFGPYADRDFVHIERHFIFRRDHGRTEWIGEALFWAQEEKVDISKSSLIKEIMTGEQYMSLINPLNAAPLGAVISRDYKEHQENVLDSSDFCGPLFGRLPGISHKGIAGLLGESNNLRLHDKQENLNGVSCYVLEATTKYGRVTAWISPEKGYNALKWVFENSRDDLFDDAPLSAKWPELQGGTSVFDCVEMQEIKDVNTVFVPKIARFTDTVKFTNGTNSGDQSDYTVSDIQIDPNFEALGAFKIDLPNGTRVHVKESPGVHYIWQNGKIVPNVDAPNFKEIDKMVDEIKKEKK